MKYHQLFLLGAALSCALFSSNPAQAGTVTWQELAATNVSQSGSNTTISSGNGTDILTAANSAGGTTSFSFSSSVSAAFNYQIIWTPSYNGERNPTTATLKLDRYAANYATASGSCASGGSGGAGSNAQSDAGSNTATINLTPPNTSASQTVGSTTYTFVGTTSITVNMVQSGSNWVGTFAIPCHAAAGGSGGFTNGGGSVSADARFKQIVNSATVFVPRIGTTTWVEINPIDYVVTPAGSTANIITGNGTDTLGAGCAIDLYNNGSYSYATSVSAKTRYFVRWLGTGTPPTTAKLTFNRWVANKALAEGCVNQDGGRVSFDAYVTTSYPVSLHASVFLSQIISYDKKDLGSTTPQSIGSITYSKAMTQDSENDCYAVFEIPISAALSVDASVYQGYGSAYAYTNFKQVVSGASVE